MRGNWRGVAVVAAMAATFSCADGHGGSAPTPPANLLLITLDTLRADHLGLYGYDRPTSPQLDLFASGAAVFRDVTCSMPTTLPSHLSIFSGLRPSEHGVRSNGQAPDRDLITIFDLLGSRGATTAAVIASGVVAPKYLEGVGFEEVVFPGPQGAYEASAELVTDQAIGWLESHGEEPFGLWVHYFDTHEPYAPPAEFARAFDRGYQGELGAVRLEVDELVGFNDRPEAEALSAEDRRHVADLYDAEIAYLDSHLGRLLRRVGDLGRLEDTLVVIVGDHGQALGESGFFGHGLRLLEPVVQVPLVLRQPGGGRGRRIEAPVAAVDLLPTMVDLLGLEPPEGLSGRSLVPLLSGGTIAARPFRLIERRTYADRPEVQALALHGGDWKAVYYFDADGSERRLLGRRSTGLDGENHFRPESEEARWLESTRIALGAPAPAEGELDEEERRMLESLGYLE